MVKESSQDINYLQQLLDISIEKAGKFLKESFKMPAHSLSAEDLIQLIDGTKTVSLATVTAKGEPRVAPIGTFFFKSKFYIPSISRAARTRHLIARPGISLTYYEGVNIAIIVHGQAKIIDNSDPIFSDLITTSGENVDNWGNGNEGVFICLEADRIFTWTSKPNKEQNKEN